MIVADTSPLNYLILIDTVEILPALFNEVAIPAAVERELLAAGADEKVRNWVKNSPDWLCVRAVNNPDENLHLGKGDSEAISLAIELSSNTILLDDKAARLSAKARGLKVIGTLGVLKYADEKHLIPFETAVKELQRTNFRVSNAIIDELKAHRNRDI